MRATIWGCRGSLATPGPTTVRYGGNTSCLEVRLEDGTLLILDAGTGILRLGLAVEQGPVQTIHLLLTHLHFDHIEGLGFFAPLWNRDFDVHIWGPPEPSMGVQERIARFFSPPLFPARLSQIPAHVTFHDFPDAVWTLGSASLLARPVAHPGPTMGLRLEEKGHTLAYIPDHEPAREIDLETAEPEHISGFALAAGVDVLLHDAQYTEAEYPERVGWGHSSVAHAVCFARTTGARSLVLFHHDPLRTDRDLEAHLKRACDLWGNERNVPTLASERRRIEL